MSPPSFSCHWKFCRNSLKRDTCARSLSCLMGSVNERLWMRHQWRLWGIWRDEEVDISGSLQECCTVHPVGRDQSRLHVKMNWHSTPETWQESLFFHSFWCCLFSREQIFFSCRHLFVSIKTISQPLFTSLLTSFSVVFI